MSYLSNPNGPGGAGVTSVAGTLVDNTNPAIPVISIFTDATITGLGTSLSPLSVAGGTGGNIVSVETATTSNLPNAPLYTNGLAGVGAKLTATTFGALPAISGAVLQLGDKILVKSGNGDGTNIANGIYDVTALGGVASFWDITRSVEADTPTELNDITAVVAQGTQSGSIFDQTAIVVAVGVSNIIWALAGSIFVKQLSSGTQTNFNIPWWTGSTSSKTLNKGTTDFSFDTTNRVFTAQFPTNGTGIVVNDVTQLITFNGNYTFPFADGNAGEALITDGAGTVSFSPVASVAGLDTQIQYNNTGAFAGDANFTWDYTNLIFSVGDSALLGNGTFITMDDTARRTTIGEDFTVKHAVTNKRFINTDFVGTGEYSFGFIDASAGGSLQTFMKVSTQGGSSKFDFTTDPGVAAVQFTIDKEFVQRYGGVIDHVTVVTAAGPYAVLRTDYNIVINQTVGAAMTVNLPAAPVAGDTYQIKDGKGDANANTITVVPNAGTIDGLANFVMNIAYQANTFIYNGTEWNIF